MASVAAFSMHNTIALTILCSPTNVASAFSKWVRYKVVELFQDCVSVVSVTIQSNNSFISVEKHSYHSFIRCLLEAEENKRLVAQLLLYHETSSTKTTQKLMFPEFLLN